jgi:hypothetical protein
MKCPIFIRKFRFPTDVIWLHEGLYQLFLDETWLAAHIDYILGGPVCIGMSHDHPECSILYDSIEDHKQYFSRKRRHLYPSSSTRPPWFGFSLALILCQRLSKEGSGRGGDILLPLSLGSVVTLGDGTGYKSSSLLPNQFLPPLSVV